MSLLGLKKENERICDLWDSNSETYFREVTADVLA